MRLTVDGCDTCVYTGARPFDSALPSIVFVHGAGSDHSAWALQSRYFAHHGRNVLAVDLPGHGRSGGAPLPSVEAIAAWIAALLDAVGVASAALVGHSMGSLAVLECAARFPGRATRIALVGPAIPMLVADALLEAAERNDHVACELITGWSYSAGKKLGGSTMPGMWLTGNSTRLLERAKPGVLHADLCACHGYASGLDAAARVGCPALVIVGARDIMAPPKSANDLIRALPDVRVVDLAGCGHALMAEAPDAILDTLAAFLAP